MFKLASVKTVLYVVLVLVLVRVAAHLIVHGIT